MFEILVNVKYKLIEPCEMMLVNNNIDYRSRLIETKILQHINKKIIKVLAKKNILHVIALWIFISSLRRHMPFTSLERRLQCCGEIYFPPEEVVWHHLLSSWGEGAFILSCCQPSICPIQRKGNMKMND